MTTYTTPQLNSPKAPEGGRLWQRKRYALAGLGLVALLVALRISTAQLPVVPWESLRDAISLSTAILIESFPFIMLGILLSILVRVWMSPVLFARLTPKNRVARRVLMSFVGTLLPVCECGNVPLARALLRQGFSRGDVIAFTLSAPLLNPVTIVTTYQAFGTDNGIVWGRVLGGFLVAQLVALLATWGTRRQALSDALDADSRATCDDDSCQYPSREETACPDASCADDSCADDSCTVSAKGHEHSRMTESLRIFRSETAILMPPLIFGALVAGLIQVGVSRSILLAVGSDPILSVLAMMALAFIISICSSVDAFFALSLAGAFTPGALIAFLIFGAMVDVKMLMLLRTTFTTGTLARIVIGVTALCALIGMGVNLSGTNI